MKPNVILLLSDDRGTNIPQVFASYFKSGGAGWHGVSQEDREDLSDPENEWYWETWDKVLSNAHYIDKPSGKVYHLYQDGDLWAVCFDSMSDEEKLNFGWDI